LWASMSLWQPLYQRTYRRRRKKDWNWVLQRM